MNESNMYTIRRNCALWQVVSKDTGKIIFSSLSKANCKDWLEVNYSENESEKMKPWSVRQLKEKLNNDLLACNTNFERSMVIAIGGKEIREFAEQLSAIRKLTPGEIAIASEYGYKG